MTRQGPVRKGCRAAPERRRTPPKRSAALNDSGFRRLPLFALLAVNCFASLGTTVCAVGIATQSHYCSRSPPSRCITSGGGISTASTTDLSRATLPSTWKHLCVRPSYQYPIPIFPPRQAFKLYLAPNVRLPTLFPRKISKTCWEKDSQNLKLWNSQ